ncbi:MAG: hypothetical protein AAF846_00955 [Chloroflexota bacterium]
MSQAQQALQPSLAQAPQSYFSRLSVRTGAIAGFIGSVAIMIAISAITIPATMEIWLAPRFIASIFLADAAWVGIFPIVLGTVIHLITGTLYGALLALITPRIPRAFWFVIAILYSIGIWAIAAYTLPNLSQSPMMNTLPYINALLISHVIFGIVLGIAGSFFGDTQAN